MNDDQHTSDQETVSSGQQAQSASPSTTHRPPSSKPDPYYADELDVLRVIAELEKKYNKSILTEEQRAKLAHTQATIGLNTQQNVIGKSFGNEQKLDLATRVVGLLLSRFESFMPEILSGEDWNELDDKSKQEVKRIMFSTIFKASPEQFRINMYKQFGGTL